MLISAGVGEGHVRASPRALLGQAPARLQPKRETTSPAASASKGQALLTQLVWLLVELGAVRYDCNSLYTQTAYQEMDILG